MKNLEGVMNFSTTRNLVVKSTLILAVALMPMSVLAADHKSESHGSAPKGGQSHAASRGGGQSHAGQSHAGGQPHAGGASHGAGATHENRGGESHAAGGHQGGAAGHEGGNAGHPGNAGNRGEGGNRGNVGGNRGGVGGNRGGVGGNRGGAVAGRGGAGRAPGRSVALRGGGRASIRPNGSIRSINRNGMHISNGLHGGRTVVSEHNGVRVVSRPGGGYVQHAYMNRGGHAYYSRTFYGHGGYHTGLYRGYFYHGFHYYGYYPGVWFHPGFYGWAWHPWGVPLYWGVGAWGWGGPWYGFYGGWWNPYPVYAGPAFWLTDYLIASELQSTYAAQYNTAAGADASQPAPSNYSDNGGGQAANGQVTLSPEVKDAIAEEVKAELAAQEQQAPTQGGAADQGSAPNNTDDNQVPPALDPARRTFVVDNTVTLVSDGQECDLTGGDVLTRLTDTPDADGKVNASVSASKKGECGAGKQVLVSVDDLQEMRNHFEEQLNNGLKELAAKQGTNGMPKAPDAATVSSDIPAPQPDQDASKELSDQQAQADQAEQQAKQDAAGQGGGGGQE